MKFSLKHYVRQFWRVLFIFILYIFGPIFIFLTNPRQLALPFLILPFLWLFAAIVCSLWLIYRVLAHKKPSRKMQLTFGLVALVPVLLAVLQSIHQLSVKDVILVVGFVLVGAFYVTRIDLGSER